MLFLCALTACATPAARFNETATGLAFTRETVLGTRFSHMVFLKTGQPRRTLHIYLDGDGSPWLKGRWIAHDPTPTDPLALQLMKADPAPAAYIGRPCYHGLKSPVCTKTLWSNARYSETVVASMTSAIARIHARCGTPGLVLIGYSGGGTLAMLIAERLPNVRAVVTLAANLDIDSWSELHGYLPLLGSLNPARSAPLQSNIVQMHYAGELDKNVPPGIITGAVATQENSSVTVIPGFDHQCCWLEKWPDILDRLHNSLAPPSATSGS